MSLISKKFAVIGKGFIYNLHAQAIDRIGGEILDIVDEPENSDGWKEMVKRTKADCIVILSPNYLHFEMAKFSAENGKVVICEKPLALKSEDVKILAQYPYIFTVCQLRYHPCTEEIKQKINTEKRHKIEIDISVYRDDSYWKSWKGQRKKSGGILFNLGIHYFDLLLYLFGNSTDIVTKLLTETMAEGVIKGKNYLCQWRINTQIPKEDQRRIFKVNGVNYDFSPKENLHFFVYKDLLEGKGVLSQEALKTIEFIEKIYDTER